MVDIISTGDLGSHPFPICSLVSCKGELHNACFLSVSLLVPGNSVMLPDLYDAWIWQGHAVDMPGT